MNRIYLRRQWFACSFLLATAIMACPVGAKPMATVAVNPDENATVAAARDLLGSGMGRAADLEARPSLWNWTNPLTVERAAPMTAQAAPVPTTAASPDEGEDNILDEVSVTATRRATRQRDITAVTYTVKKEDFAAQGAQTVTDALQLVPGFTGNPSLGGVRNAGQNFLRGFDDQRFQVLRDGLPLRYPQNGRSGVSQLTLDDFERIEVVTGGATLRYGAGAVGGVINLITETPKGPPKLTLGYEVGSYGFSRYLGKYGGGDDTFSYNFVFNSLVAFNDYPFSYTLPNTAQFYGPTSNSAAAGPFGGANSFEIGQQTGTTDPDNSGPTDLYGFLKPEVGPPVTVRGRADSSFIATDSYTGKLTFKPDPSNRLALRFNARNSNFDDQGPGAYSLSACFGGVITTPGAPNGTINGDRFLPLDSNGNEVPCTTQRFIVSTPSTQLVFFNLGGPLGFNRSLDGRLFPTGQPYLGGVEGTLGNIFLFNRRNVSETNVSLSWDTELSPSATLNNYVYYYRQQFTTFRPSPYLINTDLSYENLFVNPARIDPVTGQYLPAGATQPFSVGQVLELQSALNWQISPGQTLQLGVNFNEERVYQEQTRPPFPFLDRAIARTAIFLVDDISFSDQWKANIGLRYTSSSQFGEVITPAAGVRFSPTNWLSLRGNWSYVFNAPNIASLYVASGIFIPNPALRPESGVTYDVGVDITPAPNVGLRATYFNTYLDGAIGAALFFQDGQLVQQDQNRNSRRSSGIELQGSWQISPQFRFLVAWTNIDARNYGGVDSVDSTFYPFGLEYQDPNIPFNSVSANLVYENKGLLASLLARYDSGKRRFASTAFVPAWATLDLSVEIPITAFFKLTGNVFNLTDTQYEYLDGVPAPGTTFRVGGRFELGG